MDRRSKILATVSGAALMYALVSAVVVPKWIKPLLALDDLIAEREQTLVALEKGEAEVQRAKETYRGFLYRVGSFDPTVVENDLRERLNNLIAKYQLEDQNVTPRRPTTDRKTNIAKMTISVTATGSLASAVGFLKDIAELPHLLKVGNASIHPVAARHGDKTGKRMNLRVPIEVWILPQNRMLGRRLTDKDLTRPESFPREEGGDYSRIADRRPFTEYIPPKPLVAKAGRNLTVDAGASVTLKGTVTGGIGDHTVSWTPAEALDDAASLTPGVTDTSEIGERMFTLSVSDEGGNSSTATVTLTVREPQNVARGEPDDGTVSEVDDATVRPSAPKRWKDRKHMRSRMALIRMEGDKRVGEFMVYNVKSRESTYYATGDAFDGGQLLYVHPRGALVRRQDGYFVYPIGATLDEEVPVGEAVEHPRLQAVAEWFQSTQAMGAAKDEAALVDDEPPAGDRAPRTTDDAEGSGGVDGGPDTAAEGASHGSKRDDKTVAPEDAPSEEGKKPVTPKPKNDRANKAGTKNGGQAGAPASNRKKPGQRAHPVKNRKTRPVRSRRTRPMKSRRTGAKGKKVIRHRR